MSAKRVLVTGGNSGIGFALCRQLATEDGCHVYLGSRNEGRGSAAVADIVKGAPEAKVELVVCDVSSDESVAAAAADVKARLAADGATLYGIVNNAGTGLAHGVTAEQMLNTNLYGPKRVTEAFLPLLAPQGSRIVHVGSGGGPGWIKKAGAFDSDKAKTLMNWDVTWADIEGVVEAERAAGLEEGFGTYGFSKACLTAYGQSLAKQYPNILTSTCTPGYIDTNMTKGFGATKPPEEGTVSIRHCLFQDWGGGNGWYFGSDAERSPLHFMRNPGEPVYDGKLQDDLPKKGGGAEAKA